MTGLEIKTEFIIEIAVIVTDGSLSQIIEGPNLVINCSDEVLNNMNEWCIK
jgi:oligoribonuclease